MARTTSTPPRSKSESRGRLTVQAVVASMDSADQIELGSCSPAGVIVSGLPQHRLCYALEEFSARKHHIGTNHLKYYAQDL